MFDTFLFDINLWDQVSTTKKRIFAFAKDVLGGDTETITDKKQIEVTDADSNESTVKLFDS